MAASIAFQPMASPFTPSPASSATVMLNRSSFEILIRRANLNHNAGLMGSSLPRGQNVESIFVSKAEHDSLLVTAKRYACLQRHLLEGGVSQETISLLSENAASVAQVFPHINSPVNERQAPSSSHQYHNSQGNSPIFEDHTPSKQLQHFEPTLDWSEARGTEISDTGPKSLAPAVQDINAIAPAPEHASPSPFRPQFAKTCQRSLAISKLPDNCTLADVTAVLRGGLLLNLHHRPAERCAFVSFLHEEHAVGFLEHAKKNGLYIKNKSVAVHWADRQYYLQGHIAYQIRGGATRNLVMRRCDPGHTEASVRDDLEHIHNLVAINIEFVGGSCFIKTNSVMNAIFARTCMMSRVKYKGSSITFDMDECAQPLEILPVPCQPQKNYMPQAVNEPGAKTQNRFAVLRVDDEDNHEESFTDDDQDNSDSESVSPGSSASTNSDKSTRRV